MNMNTGMGWFWLLVIVAGSFFVLWLYFRFFKIPKIKNIVFVDGSLGSGKSFYSVYLAIRLYKRSMRRYRIAKVVLPMFKFLPAVKRSLEGLEEPLLYSNILLRNVKFTPLTKDLLFRQNYRFAYKSVVLIDEMSLMADQFCYRDRIASERLSNFFKLFRHETKGGWMVINSQSTSDLHYSIKYVLSDYLYLHHMNAKFPFFAGIAVQEMAYCGDKDGSTIVNARLGDIEDALRWVIVPKRYFKYYDTYALSIFTDMLGVYRIDDYRTKEDSLKSGVLLSFKEYKFLTENLDKILSEKKEGAK